MGRIRRLLRHRWCDEATSARALDDQALLRLERLVAASEGHHSGEIRICIESGLPLSYIWNQATARHRAITLFGKLRVWDTEQNNGVLIYVLLAERAIEIIADRGVARHVSQAEWDALVAGMREDFRAGRFEAGLERALAGVDAALRRHFPVGSGELNPNELSDRIDRR